MVNNNLKPENVRNGDQIEVSHLVPDKYYALESKDGEITLVYFYNNWDYANGNMTDGTLTPNKPDSGLGFGFNLADGFDFLPLSDLTDDTTIWEV